MIFINEHEIRLDSKERLEPWTSYDRVVRLAMDFIKHCPVDPNNGLPGICSIHASGLIPSAPLFGRITQPGNLPGQ